MGESAGRKSCAVQRKQRCSTRGPSETLRLTFSTQLFLHLRKERLFVGQFAINSAATTASLLLLEAARMPA